MSQSQAIDRHPSHEELGGYEGAKLAMWLFLATELLLFGVLFAGFALFHGKFPTEFKLAHMSLDKLMGGINTVILISSSLTAVLALDGIQRGKRTRAVWMLGMTILLAGGFLVVKYFEYSGKIGHGIIPGSVAEIVINKSGEYGPIPATYEGNPVDPKGIVLFFSFYYVMTAVHGLHVVIGMSVLAGIMIKMARGRYSHWYYTPVENGALYWHLVDLIWIYLFPLLYLVQ
jgi:cytochrome c oxidase subunit 3